MKLDTTRWRIPTELCRSGVIAAMGLMLLSQALSSVRAAEESSSFQVGAWEGMKHYKDGEFQSCAVARVYNDTLLLIQLTPDSQIRISVANERWDLGVGVEYEIELQVDRTTGRKVKASAAAMILWAELDRDWAFFEDLRKGRTLFVGTGDQKIEFALDDSSKALQKLRDCIAPEIDTADSKSHPFGAPVGKGLSGLLGEAMGSIELQGQARPIERLDFQQKLVAAGFFDAQMVSMGNPSAATRDSILMWSGDSGDLVGFAVPLPSSAARRFLDYAAEALQNNCEGHFALIDSSLSDAATSPATKHGRLKTRCVAANKTSSSFDLLAFFGDDGGLIVLHIAEPPSWSRAQAINNRLSEILR